MYCMQREVGGMMSKAGGLLGTACVCVGRGGGVTAAARACSYAIESCLVCKGMQYRLSPVHHLDLEPFSLQTAFRLAHSCAISASPPGLHIKYLRPPASAVCLFSAIPRLFKLFCPSTLILFPHATSCHPPAWRTS